MTDVLDQSEIDALLAAVDSGDGDEAESDSERKIFTFRPEGVRKDIEIKQYDFKRPERVSKDQMRALKSLHEAYARSFGALVSGFMRTIMEVNVSNIEQMTYSEFTHSLPNPTCFSLISPDALDGTICLEISPLIIYPVIDRLLGGSNSDLFIPQRPLTAIELRLVTKIIDRAMLAMTEAWAEIIDVKFKLEHCESNPQLVQIVPPNEVVIVVSFEIKMGGRAGTMALCIPYNVIEPVIEKLSSQSWAAYQKQTDNKKNKIRVKSHLDSAKLTVTAILADTNIKLGELMNLQIGDIILTEKPSSAPLTLKVGDKRKYIGHMGQFKGNRAFKVSRPINPKDRV